MKTEYDKLFVLMISFSLIVMILGFYFICLEIVNQKYISGDAREKLAERYFCIRDSDSFQIDSWDGAFSYKKIPYENLKALDDYGLKEQDCFNEDNLQILCQNSERDYDKFYWNLCQELKNEN